MKSTKSSASEKTPDLLRAGYFLAWQVLLILDTARFIVLEKSRRIGGTYVVAFKAVRAIIKGEVPAVYFSSADLSAAREFIGYCVKWAKVFNLVAEDLGEVILDDKKDVKAFVIEIKGRKIHALSSNPKAFRSKGGMLILDEFAWHDDPEAMWTAARPIITWGFPVIILSTHNGVKSRFNRFVEQIKAGKLPGWALHTVPIQKAVEEGLVEKIYGWKKRKATPEEKQIWLDGEKSACDDEETWQQEYCCNPLDESSAFLTYELIRRCERPGILTGLGNVTGDLILGFDVARKTDLSVIRVGERLGQVIHSRMRIAMRNETFSEQKRKLWPLLAHPNMRRACFDATGLGMQIAEEAQRDFGKYKVEAVTFTTAVKESLAYGIRTEFEDQTLLIEEDEVVRESLHSIRKLTTAAGNARFDADRSEKTGHADDFWALALMREAARSRTRGEPIAESLSFEDVYGDPNDPMEQFSSYSPAQIRDF